MEHQQETTPDQLLDTFQGRSLKTIIVFTVLVHLVVVLGSSILFLWNRFAGNKSAGLSEDERMKLAVKEATASLRDIAESHNLRPQDLAGRMDGGAPKARPVEPPAASAPEATPKPEGPSTGTPAPEPPKSGIEEEIEKVKDGPTTPPVGGEEVDLFK
jgi:hypothetical protein